MTAQDDLRGDDPQTDPQAPPTPGLGGGLLGLVREEVTALRTSAAVERAALIDTIAAKLTDLEQQLSELRADVASARSEGETSRLTAAGSIAEVQQTVASQADGIVEAVVAALRPQLEQTAAEVTYLRSALLGPAS
jgi:hypothetical protein